MCHVLYGNTKTLLFDENEVCWLKMDFSPVRFTAGMKIVLNNFMPNISEI